MPEIYNTLSAQVEPLTSQHNREIKMFVCGPTVYGLAHIGNAKTFTQFDMVAKYFRYRQIRVFYLQNITDIDDKIIAKAKEEGVSWAQVSDLYTREFLQDMAALGNDGVNQYARATEYIEQIVSQVTRLEELGAAYRTTDGIYYDVSKFPDYGKLSGRTDVQPSDGVSRIDSSSEKRDPRDFCLWKFPKSEDEPAWDTALGQGRPGWHIEDTAITEHFFGPQYDIHGGAIDLKMPHHEAEIAQMEMISGRSPLVRYWMHAGFLITNGEKMSKSLGNYWTIRDVLSHYSHRVVRLMFLGSHYRSSLEYREEVLQQAKNSLRRLDEFVFSIDPTLVNEGETERVDDLRQAVITAMDSDLDTPKALAAIFKFITDAHSRGTPGQAVYNYLQEINSFFGFFDFSRSSDPEIEALVTQRDEYRRAKNWAAADQIKATLLEKNIKIYDGKDGTTWRREEP